MTDDAPVPFINNPFSPEVFASAATGFFVSNGNITITFESLRVDHSANPGPMARVIVGRLVMPIAGAQGLALGLYDFLEKQGIGNPKPDPKKIQ